MYDYDLSLLTGPGGQRAAVPTRSSVNARRRGSRCHRRRYLYRKGTIPSKTLREAALYLSGYRERNFYGAVYGEARSRWRICYTAPIMSFGPMDVIRHQLQRNGIDLHRLGQFRDGHAIRLDASEQPTYGYG